jgi:predicted PurR-regulated permease PerM
MKSHLSAIVLPVRILAGCAIVGMLYVGRPVLIPIVLSVFLFYALDPVVDWLQRWRVPRALGAVAVVLMLVGGTGAGAVALWPQMENVLTQIPAGVQRLRATLRRSLATSNTSALQKVQAAAAAIDKAAAESAPAVADRGTVMVEMADPWRVSDLLWSSGLGMLARAGQVIGVLFLTVFLLIEDDAFKRKLVRRMDSLGEKRVTVGILNDVATQIERFIWVQAVTSAGVALVTALALWGLGVAQPAVWGVFAGVMNLVPFFGPFIVTCVIGAVAFLQFGSLTSAALIAGVTLAITSIEGNIVTPHLLSRAASLNLVVMFVAIAFWSGVWGVAGMLLAVPILMAVKAVADRVEGFEALADFLSA